MTSLALGRLSSDRQLQTARQTKASSFAQINKC
uniref:Uncharacterized protein n=1 Tax=Anguilla anguilla TaxID=7936 RepID=A0A0E9TBW7_ANGAN